MMKAHGLWLLPAGRQGMAHGILFFLALYAVLCTPYPAFAQTISSTELIKNAKHCDGKAVVYVGEVIGDIMVRGEYAWINVHDGNNAIGIWIGKDLTKDILYTGSYKSRGDWVGISGTFQRICSQHGGDLDIHAQAIRIISRGREIRERLNLSKSNQAIVLLVILGIIWISTLLKRKQRRI